MIRHLFFFAACANALAGDWPQFRGPAGDGHSPAKNVPTEWSKTSNIAWRVEPPGKGWSSPVVVDGCIYLTAAVPLSGEDNDSADRSLRVMCLEARSGAMIWNEEVFPQPSASSPKGLHKKNGHASPTPVVQDGRIYLHFGHQGSACFTTAGKKVWENRSFKYEPQHGGGSSPVIVGDRMVFSCDGRDHQFVLALKTKTGEIAWNFKRATEARSKFAFCTAGVITVNGKPQIISPGADVVNALDPYDGKEIWHARYEGYSIVPKPVFGDGMVYISSSFDSPEVLAIDPTGTGDVTDTHVKWVESKYAPMTPSMLFDNGLLYMVTDAGIICCREAKSGNKLWESDRILGGVSASPVLAEGRIYVLDERGTCAILAAGREYKLLGKATLEGERTLASIAVDDNTIYLRSESALYCIRK